MMSLASATVLYSTRAPARGLLRYSRWDALLTGLALVHGGLLFLFPSPLVVALGLWWNSNTISHNFIHRPFFRRRPLNWLFGAYLSVLLGIPQPLWRDRHLAHHEGRGWHLQVSRELAVHMTLVVAVWTTIVWCAPT